MTSQHRSFYLKPLGRRTIKGITRPLNDGEELKKSLGC